MRSRFSRSFAVLVALAGAACTDQPFTVDVALRVVSVSPSGGGVGAGRREPIVVTFSEELDAATVTAGSISLAEVDGAPVEGALAYSNEGGAFTATLTPAAPLKYSTRYLLTLTTDLQRRRDGSPLPVKVTSGFRTVDQPPLYLVAVSPDSGATGVERTARIELTFSEPLSCASLAGGATLTEVFDAHPHTAKADAPLAGTWSCREPTGDDALEGAVACAADPGLCTVSFTPADAAFQFGWSSVIEVALTGGQENPAAVRSFRATADGGHLAQSVAWDFRVVDPPALLLLSSLPGGAGGDLRLAPATLLRDGSIALELSEPVDCQTANAQTLAVSEDPDPTDAEPGAAVPMAIAECEGAPAGTATETLTLTRADAGRWAYSAVVTVTLAGGPFGAGVPAAWPADALESAIATRYGGQLAQDLTLTLVVEDPPPLLVLHTEPGAGASGAPTDTAIKVVFNMPVRLASLGANTGAPSAILDLTGVNAFDRATRTRADLPEAALPGCVVSCPVNPEDAAASAWIDPADEARGSACVCEPRSGGAAHAFDLSSLVSGTVGTQVRSHLATWRAGALAAPYDFTFRTADPRPLLVANTWPGHQEAMVPVKVWCNAQSECSAAPEPGVTAAERRTGIAVLFDRPFDCPSALGVTAAGPNTVLVEDLTAEAAILTGTVQCLDAAGQVSPDGAVQLLYIPDAEFPFEHEIQLTVARADIAADAAATTSNTGVRSLDWTDFAEDSAGTLVQPLRVRFTMARRPLEVIATLPHNGEQDAGANRIIELTFNQPVACDAAHTELESGGVIIQRVGEAGECAGQADGTPCSAGSCSAGLCAAPPLALDGFDCATDWDAATHTALFRVQDPAATRSRLVPGATYQVRVLRGGHPTGPHDLSQQAYLPADFVMKFKVSTSSLRGYELPPDLSTGVNPDQLVCAVFSAPLDNASPAGLLRVSFTDCTGRTVPVQGTAQFWSFPDPLGAPEAGAPTADPATTPGNAVCFVPRLASYNCVEVPQLLPYGTDFTATVTGATAPDEPQPTSFSWTFRTMDPPQLESAVYRNEVLAGAAAEPLRPAVGEPDDVPVNSELALTFAAPLDRATVSGANVTLVDLAGGQSYALCPDGAATGCLGARYEGGDRTLVLALQAGGAPRNLAFATRYRLQLEGGAQGLAVLGPGAPSSTTGQRDYLAADVAWSFTTSPATRVEFNPGSDLTNTTPGASLAWSVFPDEEIPVVFSRPIRLSSANTNNIYGRDPAQTPTRMSGIVALNADDQHSAVLITSPTFTKSTSGVAVVVTTGMQDFRGNPLPLGASADAADPEAALKSLFNCGNTPSLASQIPTAISCGSIAPNAGGTCVDVPVRGDQDLVVTFGASSAQNDRFLPSSFNADSVWITGTGGAAADCPTERIELRTRYEIARATSAGDKLHVSADFRAGCTYTLTLNQSRFANVYNLGNTSAPVTVQLVGETVAPALDAAAPIAGRTPEGLVVPLADATTIAGDSPFVVTFTENMRDEPGAAVLQDLTAGITIPGTLRYGPNTAGTCTSCVATFVPQRYATTAGLLQAGHDFHFTVTSLFLDLAGNALAQVTSGFKTETTAPTVVGAVVTPDAPLLGQRTITLGFSEAVDPATVVADTFTSAGLLDQAGTVRLVDANGGAVAGCVSVDAADPKKVVFVTTDDLYGTGTSGQYTLSVETSGPAGLAATGVTDAAGNPLGAAWSQGVTMP